MGGDVPLRRLPEGYRLGGLSRLGDGQRPPLLERIEALGEHLSGCQCLAAGIREASRRVGPWAWSSHNSSKINV